MLFSAYYAKNYAGIIEASLIKEAMKYTLASGGRIKLTKFYHMLKGINHTIIFVQ